MVSNSGEIKGIATYIICRLYKTTLPEMSFKSIGYTFVNIRNRENTKYHGIHQALVLVEQFALEKSLLIQCTLF